MEETKDYEKPRYLAPQPVMVNKVLLETTGKNKEYVERVRLLTDIGDITYKPKKIVSVTDTSGEIEEVYTEPKLFLKTEFLTNNKKLVVLAKNCKNEPQEIWITPIEIGRFNDIEQEVLFYKYLSRNNWESLYYDRVDKTDKLKKQQIEKAEKHKGEEL